MGCLSSKPHNLIHSRTIDSVKSHPPSEKTVEQKAFRTEQDFPWLVKAVTAPKLRLQKNKLWKRRKSLCKVESTEAILYCDRENRVV